MKQQKQGQILIITGAVGSGKTTVCKKVLETARNTGCRCGGIITHKMPGDTLAVENVRTGATVTLAVPGDRYGGPLVPRFTFDPEGIDFGMRALEQASDDDIVFVDEIGIIETMGEGFIKAFDIINAGSMKNSILVIREELLEYLIPGLNRAPVVFTTNEQNRDRLPEIVFSALTGI
jgi:nucleoside-triphosphatase THEP1